MKNNPLCPECGSNKNVRVVENDGGYECLDCQTPEHESWFWANDLPEDADITIDKIIKL